MTRFFAIFILLGSFRLLFCPAHAVGADHFSFDLAEETLSIAADNIPLQTILREFAARGIRVRIDPAINPPLSANFTGRPLEEALEFILKPASYSLIWQQPATRDRGVLQLAEIQVFQTGKQDMMRPLKPRRVLAIAKNSRGDLHVKDEILVYLPPGTDQGEIADLLRSWGATIVGGDGLEGLVKILLPENSDILAFSRKIKHELGISFAEPNYVYPIQSPVNLPAGSAAAGVTFDTDHAVPDNIVPIAILDSGLTAASELGPLVLASLDVINPGLPLTDSLGHGTQMAYIASGMITPYGAGAEPGTYIPIIPIRAFDDDGFTSDFMIIEAINFAVANKARILSLSWGNGTRSPILEKAFASASARGLVIVASAGNEPTGKPVYPAAYPAVIGVGALEPHGRAWEQSNYGTFVEIYAPGFADMPVGYNGKPGLYGGTSIAAAFSAHAIARYLSEHPAATLQEIEEYLGRESKTWGR